MKLNVTIDEFINSKYKILLIVGISVFFSSGTIIAQIEHPGYPLGLKMENISRIEFVQLPSADMLYNQFSEENSDEKVYKKNVFASSVEVDLSPASHGLWYSGDNNWKTWYIGITAEHASSLNLIFGNFHLSHGCRLFVYSPDGKVVYGAFTFRNNKKSNVLAITPIRNDSLIIEFQVDHFVKDFGELILSKVGVGFPGQNVFKGTEDEYFRWSADCHVDVNCIAKDNIQKQKYSVCRIIYNGSTRCTGTLINNTEEDGRPLILTAGHCIMDESDAESALYFFDYESPYCEGPDGKIKSISGSTLLSRGYGLDFSLTEMSEKPYADYYPMYAGWDAVDKQYADVYILHHPEGDVKKITTDADILQIGSFPPFDNETHWLVEKYDTGTTEPGSSGAALFNADNRVVGTLTGGEDACTEYIFDYYQMFSHCWADYPYEDEQLKAWLDPFNSGKTFMESYSPVDPLYAVSEELSNLGDNEKDTLINCNSGWGYISGHNYLYNTNYAEYFSMNGTKYIYAVKMLVSKLRYLRTDSKIKIKIWKGQENYNDLIYEQDVYYFEMIENQENFIRLDTILYVNEEFYAGYEINYNNPEDTFALSTTVPKTETIENSAFYWDRYRWRELTDGINSYSTSLFIQPVVMNYYPADKQNPGGFPVHEVTLYPNPTYGDLQVLFKSAPSGDVDLKAYDLSGKLVLKVTYNSPEPNFVLSTGNLAQGVYLLKITENSVETTLKFVKL